MSVLEDVVALVISRFLGPVDTKQALSHKLEGLGAKLVSRLGKEVTHIIFMRQRTADAQEQAAEDSELRALYGKTSKVQYSHEIMSSP